MKLAACLILLASTLHADVVRVRQIQGAAQGFLVVRDISGKQIGTGNEQQTAHGGTVTSRLVFKLNDGSVDDETTTYTQDRVFRVLTDRHVQHGPMFEKPVDVCFDTATGMIVSRSEGGAESKERQKDIPADVSNGIVGTILLNVQADASPFELSMIVPNDKGRLIKLKVSSEGQGDFTISGVPHKANIFRIHPELGGIASVVAPVVGKQPKDVLVWVLPGSAPALVREVAQLTVGGPVLSIELAGTHFRELGGL